MTTRTPPAVPGFELGDLLGVGGSGEVWSAVRLDDGHRVAVKVVRAEPDAVDAAAREAAVTSRVAAEHVLAVEACLALEDGRTALVLPLVRGGSLGRLVAARGHLSPGEVVTVLAPLAAALGRLHAAGVVHGDVSPGNVLLHLDGRPVLADLGLGRVVGEAPTAVWGTEGHLAPEVLMGAEPGPAGDVYALGALGWLCLCGSVPGAPGLRPGLAGQSRAGPAADGLVTLLETAVSPEPAERPTADELAWLLFGIAEPSPLHLVAGEDDVSAVTYRLRAAASAPQPQEVGERRRPRLPRWRPDPRRAAAAGAVVLGVVVGGGVLAGVAGALPADEDPVAGHRNASTAATPAPSASPTASARPSGKATTTDPPVTADPRSDRDAADTRPVELLEVLVEARAQAWRTADTRHLSGAEVDGGAARVRDEKDVGALAAAGLRYTGLSYTVDGARALESGPSRAVLRAALGTSSYAVTGDGPASRRPASAARTVDVVLTFTADGWRIEEVR